MGRPRIRKQVLTAALRVKNEEQNLPRCLENLARFCDHIVAYDDGSTDGTVKLLRSHRKVRHVVSMNKGFYHETHDRSIALALATLTDPDWIVKWDADETLEERGVENIRRLMEIPGYKAWMCQRFNFVGDERHGDLETMHPLMFRYAPGKVFYYNIKFHKTFPNVDQVDGLWGRVNFRVKHFGYLDKQAKLTAVEQMGYTFGDYLNRDYEWIDEPRAPLLYQTVRRPPNQAATEPPNEPQPSDWQYTQKRFSLPPDEIDRRFVVLEDLLGGLSLPESEQLIDRLAALVKAKGSLEHLLRLTYDRAIFHYLWRDRPRARELFELARTQSETVWPFLHFRAGLYLERLAADDEPLSLVPPLATEPAPFEVHNRFRRLFLPEFLRRRGGRPTVLFGGGHHTLVMDDEGAVRALQPVGYVEEIIRSGSINAPRLTLDEAARIQNAVLLFSGFKDDALWRRVLEFGAAKLVVQPMYSMRPDGGPFWFDDYQTSRSR